MRLSVTLCLSFNIRGIRALEGRCQLLAKLRKMIKELCVRQLVRSEYFRVSVDHSNPGLEDFFATAQHKIAETGNILDADFCDLSEASRNPPYLMRLGQEDRS